MDGQGPLRLWQARGPEDRARLQLEARPGHGHASRDARPRLSPCPPGRAFALSSMRQPARCRGLYTRQSAAECDAHPLQSSLVTSPALSRLRHLPRPIGRRTELLSPAPMGRKAEPARCDTKWASALNSAGPAEPTPTTTARASRARATNAGGLMGSVTAEGLIAPSGYGRLAAVTSWLPDRQPGSINEIKGMSWRLPGWRL